jgi:hypothetical protein
MKRPIPAALAVTVLLSCPVAAAAPPEIRGVVCAGDPCRPLPGLLVALYGADDLLLDSTYTRNDGGFRLRTPSAKGRSYVVVTRAESAIRKDFDFDPAVGRSANLEVKFAGEKGGLWGAVLPLLGMLSPFVGFLFGLFLRPRLAARVAAQDERKYFYRALGLLVADQLREFPKGTPLERAQKLDQVKTAVHSLVQFLENRSGIEGDLVKLGPGEVEDFNDLKSRIKERDQALNDAGTTGEMADAIGAAERELREIQKQHSR